MKDQLSSARLSAKRCPTRWEKFLEGTFTLESRRHRKNEAPGPHTDHRCFYRTAKKGTRRSSAIETAQWPSKRINHWQKSLEHTQRVSAPRLLHKLSLPTREKQKKTPEQPRASGSKKDGALPKTEKGNVRQRQDWGSVLEERCCPTFAYLLQQRSESGRRT